MGPQAHPFVCRHDRPRPIPTLLLADEIREAWRNDPRDHRVALVFIAVVTVTLRLMYLGQPMRYDESATWVYFARQPWPDALSVYTYPSNHLFHTLLVKVAASIAGPYPWALRLPAFVAGVLIVPATYAVARVLYGAGPALFAAAIVASSGVLTLYSTNARGYSIVILAFLLLVLLGARLMQRSERRLWIAFAVIAALGMWTIPVMLYPLGAVCVWLALTFLLQGRRAELRSLGGAIVAAAVLTALAYMPVVSREGISAVTRNAYVVPGPWLDFFDTMSLMLRDLLRSWSLGLPPLATFVLGLFGLVALRYHSRVSRLPVGIPLAAFVWSAWVLVVNHRAPFPRVFLWILPIAAALVGAGIFAVADRRPRWAALVSTRASVIAIGVAVAAFASVVLSRTVLLSHDTGTYRDAAEAAARMRSVLRAGDRVVAAVPSNAPLAYYFDRLGIPRSYFTVSDAETQRVIVVVDDVERQTLNSVVARSVVSDTARFSLLGILTKLPSSTLYVFQRRASATR